MPVLRIKPNESIVISDSALLTYRRTEDGKRSLEVKSRVTPAVIDPSIAVYVEKKGNSLNLNITGPTEIPIHRLKIYNAMNGKIDFTGWGVYKEFPLEVIPCELVFNIFSL